MFTGTTSHAGALVTAIVVLTGAAILRGGPAAADPNQDDQFLALLAKQEIPAVRNVPSLIAKAHEVCRKLDGGMPVDDLVDAMRNKSYEANPIEHQYPPARITHTVTRFITASVEAYCPSDQRKIASITANPAPGSNEPMHPVAAHTHNAVNSGSGLREPPPALGVINMPAAWQEPTGTGVVRLPHVMDGGVFVAGRSRDGRSDCDAHGTVLASLIRVVPSGEVTLPTPPKIPAPPPPRQVEPLPQQPPPPPQQVEPPAVAPQPGDAASGGGGGGDGSGGDGFGGGGDGGPAEPSPPMPPGFVRLAP